MAKDHPDAVVVFIGANEGYTMPGPGGKDVSCCGPEWAAIYATRARQMMNTYRQAGAAQVFWLTVPTPRDPARQRIERTVNQAIEVAAQPWRDQVHLIDTVPVFTPGDRYRDSMPSTGATRSSASQTASTSTRPARASPPTSSSARSTRSSLTSRLRVGVLETLPPRLQVARELYWTRGTASKRCSLQL